MVTRLAIDVGVSTFNSFKRMRSECDRLEKMFERKEDFNEDLEGVGFLAYYRSLQGNKGFFILLKWVFK